MKNKGFTLVELLAVIVVLSAIILIVAISTNSTLNNAKIKLTDIQISKIEEAAELYYLDEGMSEADYIDLDFNDCIDVSYLIENDYIEKNEIINPKEESSMLGSVKITYNSNKYKYKYQENSCSLLSSEPVISSSLTPVIYDGDNWRIADVKKEWYNYDEQIWANAVILNGNVNKEIGDVITVDGDNPDALAMFVWIPRYEYKITTKSAGEISVNFVSVNDKEASEGYRIHPAFTFGNEELPGIWVGKFETSHETLSSSVPNNLGCSNENCDSADGLRILPNVKPLKYNDVANMFYASRSMSRNENSFGIDSNELNTHMIKNIEWGAVAYLSQSKYGKFGNEDYTFTQKGIYENYSEYTGIGPSVYPYDYDSYLKCNKVGNQENTTFTMINDSRYPWTEANSVYQVSSVTSYNTSTLTFDFTVDSPISVLTFDWSVVEASTRDYTYVKYWVYKNGMNLGGGSLPGGSTGTNVSSAVYKSISKDLNLGPGNYQIKFNFTSNKATGAALLKNLKLNSCVSSEAVKISIGSISMGASTTGNVTGIYDMNGGATEYVMGNYNKTVANSGFITMPEDKYYDLYTDKKLLKACNGGICYGHALSETYGWYGDWNEDFYIYDSEQYVWLARTNPGIFINRAYRGYGSENISFRVVITPTESS